jgi:MFS family permease
MVRGRGGAVVVPSYGVVLRTPSFLPIFLASTLSTWGDYIARVTIASVVFAWTGSAIATAATFAVSLVPSILGRALLGPLCDRFPPRLTLVGTHLLRAVMVGLLMLTVTSTESVPLVLALVFLLEFVGGPAVTAAQMLLTDVFADRRVYSRAFGLTTLATQINQAIGLAVGGAVVAGLGDAKALLLDLCTFLVGAALLALVRIRSRTAVSSDASFLRDLTSGFREIRRNRVLSSLLWLSLASALAIAAPEAVAIPYASNHSGSASWGGTLMAAPILGAVAGLLLIGRFPAERQSALIMRLALVMPLPLLVTIVEPPLPLVWLAWFACGALQCYMLPLQAAFTLLVPTAMRGRVFGLAGALSVGVTGVCFLVAGWVSEHTSPAAAVGICAVVALGMLVLIAARWPREEVTGSIEATFSDDPEGEERSATGQTTVGIAETERDIVTESRPDPEGPPTSSSEAEQDGEDEATASHSDSDSARSASGR